MLLRLVFHTICVIGVIIVAVVAIGLLVPAFMVYFAAWVDRDNIRADLIVLRSHIGRDRRLKAMSHG